jgi:hypothetical protein
MHSIIGNNLKARAKKIGTNLRSKDLRQENLQRLLLQLKKAEKLKIGAILKKSCFRKKLKM